MNKEELRRAIQEQCSMLRQEASRPDVHRLIDRLAHLNVRSINPAAHGPLAHEEEIERLFFSISLPHVSRIGQFTDLLAQLDNPPMTRLQMAAKIAQMINEENPKLEAKVQSKGEVKVVCKNGAEVHFLQNGYPVIPDNLFAKLRTVNKVREQIELMPRAIEYLREE